MPAPSRVTMTVAKNTAAAAAGSLVAGIAYASLIERNAFVMREHDDAGAHARVRPR